MLQGGQASPLPRGGAAAVPDAGHAVELAAVPVRAAQRVDRPGVVQERVSVAQHGLEPELEADVRLAVAGVIDVDLVEHGVAELVEVRPARRAPRAGHRCRGKADGSGVQVVGISTSTARSFPIRGLLRRAAACCWAPPGSPRSPIPAGRRHRHKGRRNGRFVRFLRAEPQWRSSLWLPLVLLVNRVVWPVRFLPGGPISFSGARMAAV
jgi:hypothetical protein